MPESYIGIISAHEDAGLAADVKRFRENVQNRQHSLFQNDMRKKTAEEEETKFLVRQAEQAWLFLSNSPAYKAANMENEILNELNQGILSGLARIQKLKRNLIGFLDAREHARKEYLPATDHQFLLDYENKIRQCEDLERLSKELIPPTGKYAEDIQAFQTIERGIEKKISDLRSFLVKNNQQYWAIQGKLEEPYRRKNVELVMNRLLQNDLDVFPSEAMNIAKNIFVHDGFKKLRFEQEEYEKALADYKRKTSEMCERELLFSNRKWRNQAEKFQAQYYLTKEKIDLEETGRRLSDTKIRLEKELTRLENLCQTEEAQEKIALLAADILHKNLKNALEYEEAKKQVGDLYEKLQGAKKRFNAFDGGYRKLKQNRVYRVIKSESNSTKTSALKENELVAIIADALLGEPYAVQLVAHSTGSNLEMEKDWELMSELDKDEIIQKEIVREL